MRPFLAESLDLARSGRCDNCSVFGDGHFFMTHKALADPFSLVLFMIEGYPLLEFHDVSCERTGRH